MSALTGDSLLMQTPKKYLVRNLGNKNVRLFYNVTSTSKIGHRPFICPIFKTVGFVKNLLKILVIKTKKLTTIKHKQKIGHFDKVEIIKKGEEKWEKRILKHN